MGCTFSFEMPQPVSAVLQVAPSGRDVEMRAERAPGWERVQAIVDFVHDHPPQGRS